MQTVQANADFQSHALRLPQIWSAGGREMAMRTIFKMVIMARYKMARPLLWVRWSEAFLWTA